MCVLVFLNYFKCNNGTIYDECPEHFPALDAQGGKWSEEECT